MDFDELIKEVEADVILSQNDLEIEYKAFQQMRESEDEIMRLI